MKDRGNSGSPTSGVILLIILTVILFLTVSFFLYRADLLNLPSFIEDMFGDDTDTTQPDNEYHSLYNSLRDELASAEGAVPVKIDEAMLTNLFLSAAPPEQYYQSLTVSYSHNGKSFVSSESVILRDGDNFSVQVSSNGETVKTVLAGPTAIRTSGSSNGLTRTFSSSGAFSASDEAGIPDLSYIAELVSIYIDSQRNNEKDEITSDPASEVEDEAPGSEADDGINVIEAYEVSASVLQDGNFMYISFEYSDLSITELFKISLDFNVIWEAESRFENGDVFYRASTSEFTTDISDRTVG